MEVVLTPIQEGIQLIGVGRHGSKNCSAELSLKIAEGLQSRDIDVIQAGAFLGALWMKGVSETEMNLKSFTPGSYFKDIDSEHLVWFEKITTDKILTPDESYRLGKFLFNESDTREHLKALFASALRVRHAEAVEYIGIYKAMSETFKGELLDCKKNQNRRLISLSDPFDGVDRSHVITPLIADGLNELGFDCVVPCGISSGPKFGLNTFDIAKATNDTFLRPDNSFDKCSSAVTRYLNIYDLSTAYKGWNHIRKKMMKRPFLATLEKMVNPYDADLFIGSVFHGGFNEKMIDVAEGLNFKNILIVFRAIEGTLGLSLARSARFILSRQLSDGTYERFEFEENPESFGLQKQIDPQLDATQVKQNTELLDLYRKTGSSKDEYFDRRVQYNKAVYKKIIDLVFNG